MTRLVPSASTTVITGAATGISTDIAREAIDATSPVAHPARDRNS